VRVRQSGNSEVLKARFGNRGWAKMIHGAAKNTHRSEHSKIPSTKRLEEMTMRNQMEYTGRERTKTL